MPRGRARQIILASTAIVMLTAAGAALAPAASANSKHGGKLSVKTSKRVVSAETLHSSGEYTITVRGRTPAGSKKVQLVLTDFNYACPASAGDTDVLQEHPAGGHSFKYSKDEYNTGESKRTVQYWCAYASFAPRGGGTVDLHASVKVTLLPRS